MSKMRYLTGVIGCWALLAGPWQAAQAAWNVTTNGLAGFNSPTAYANLRTIDFSTITMAAEQTASRLTYSSSLAGSGGAISYTDSLTGLNGFAGNSIQIASGTSTTVSSLTVNFPNGGTSYVAFLWGLSVKDQNSQYVTYTMSDATTVTLYNCQSTSSSTCVGSYVPSNWLSNFLGALLGGNSYDSIYLSYVPPSGVTITKIQFFNSRCSGCGFLGSNASQNLDIDNLSYVDPQVAPHHIEITAPSATITTATPVTFTVTACADAACSSLYTTGLSGTLGVSGTGVVTTYPDAGGSTYTIGARSSSTTIRATMTPAGTVTVALTSPSRGSPPVYCGMGTAAASGGSCVLTAGLPFHHLEVTTPASSGVTCNPITYTIKACSDAACSSVYTGGVAGTLTVSGTGMTVVPPTQAFVVPASGTVTASAQAVTVGTVTAALSAVLPAATSTYYCGMGTSATVAGASNCNYTTANAALLFSVPNHYAGASKTVSVTAIRASDNASVCLPGFASVTRSILFKCSYGNPSTGTKAPVVGGVALNATNSAAAACDSTGQTASLTFDATGLASMTFAYADAGQVNLTANYVGSALTADTGLAMAGTTSFIAAPYNFVISGVTSGTLTAGSAFSATVTAKNYLGAVVPNFGRETSPEGATLSFIRARPTGTSAVNGTFSGTLGSFTSGAASSSALTWSEVGYGDVAAALTSGSYLGSGMKVVGSSAGSIACAAEGATCTLPTGATATVFFGANGAMNSLAGQTGSVNCTSAVFGDPNVGVAKTCSYVVTSGAAPGLTGAVGPFIPHHFDLSTSNSCGAFTYSGQPFAVSLIARNAAGVTTANYDGTVNTSPNLAKAITLSAVSNGGTGALTNATLALGTFTSGVASAVASPTSPTFTFTSKLTSATTVGLRAIDADGVSSSGYTEGSVALRSGQLKVSNAFGSEKASLTVPVQVQYWSGKAWVLNSADSCTSVPLVSVGRSNYLDYKGAATAAWATTASAVTVVGGNGNLTLSAPSPTASGSVDIAFNLGATTADNGCGATHAVVTGAALPWLRSNNGNCAATFDRDPMARITFGVYSPETKKTVHVRDVY